MYQIFLHNLFSSILTSYNTQVDQNSKITKLTHLNETSKRKVPYQNAKKAQTQ